MKLPSRTPIAVLSCLVVLCAAAMCSGCSTIAALFSPEVAIDAEAIAPLTFEVLDQHDESVERDAALVPAEKEQAIRNSATLRSVFIEALAEGGAR